MGTGRDNGLVVDRGNADKASFAFTRTVKKAVFGVAPNLSVEDEHALHEHAARAHSAREEQCSVTTDPPGRVPSSPGGVLVRISAQKDESVPTRGAMRSHDDLDADQPREEPLR